MTYRAERKRMKVRSGRVHAVSRLYPARSGTTVKFVCGEITGFGELHQCRFEEDLLTAEEISCARCAYSLERAEARERERITRARVKRNKVKRAARAAAKAAEAAS